MVNAYHVKLPESSISSNVHAVDTRRKRCDNQTSHLFEVSPTNRKMFIKNVNRATFHIKTVYLYIVSGLQLNVEFS
jgi:hypothetical protein